MIITAALTMDGHFAASERDPYHTRTIVSVGTKAAVRDTSLLQCFADQFLLSSAILHLWKKKTFIFDK